MSHKYYGSQGASDLPLTAELVNFSLNLQCSWIASQLYEMIPQLHQMAAEFHQMGAELHQMGAQLHQMGPQLHQTGA